MADGIETPMAYTSEPMPVSTESDDLDESIVQPATPASAPVSVPAAVRPSPIDRPVHKSTSPHDAASSDDFAVRLEQTLGSGPQHERLRERFKELHEKQMLKERYSAPSRMESLSTYTYRTEAPVTYEAQPLLQTWKTSYLFSILGVFAWALVMTLFGGLYWLASIAFDASLILGIILGVVVLILLLAYAVALFVYPTVFYPSYFTEKPRLRSNRLISFLNFFVGAPALLSGGFPAIIPIFWNSNLTKRKKGISHIVFIVLLAINLAIVGVSALSGARTGSTGVAASGAQQPTTELKLPVAESIQPLERTEGAIIYTDTETGASFVVPDTWTQIPFTVNQAGRKAKFRIPDAGSAFYGSYAVSAEQFDNMISNSDPDVPVQKITLNGVGYSVLLSTTKNVKHIDVFRFDSDKGFAYYFGYARAGESTGAGEEEALQNFYSMVASMSYPS